VEKKISNFVNTLDFRRQSKEVDLYAWMFDVNAGIKLIEIHNVIIKKFLSYDRDFMYSAKHSLKNHSHPLKDIIDIVGKHISQRSLKVFIEMVEGNPRTSSGGIRDKKIPAVVVIRSSLQAVYETSTVSVEKVKTEQKEVFDYNESKNDYYVKGKGKQVEKEEKYEDSEYSQSDDGEHGHDGDGADSEDAKAQAKHDDDLQELTKIAHRYVFGNRGGLEELKKQVEQQLEEDDLTEEELLESKL
jgi:hypothetical protein